MAPVKNLYHITAPDPDGRVKSQLVIAVNTTQEVQAEILNRKLDVEKVRVFFGQELPVRIETRVELGEPKKRRGRPPGSKNKPRLEVEGAAAAPKKTRRSKKAKRAAKARNAKVVNGVSLKETQAQRNARLEATT